MLLAVLAIEGSGINVGAVSGMAQVNVRVDRQVKNRAEEVLRLSGRSLSLPITIPTFFISYLLKKSKRAHSENVSQVCPDGRLKRVFLFPCSALQ